MRDDMVVGNRAARLKASRRHWRGLQKASRHLVKDVRRPLSEERDNLQAQLLKVRAVPDDEAQSPQFHVMMPDLTTMGGSERLTNFTFHALERAVVSITDHFEADENGWPVWREATADAEDQKRRQP